MKDRSARALRCSCASDLLDNNYCVYGNNRTAAEIVVMSLEARKDIEISGKCPGGGSESPIQNTGRPPRRAKKPFPEQGDFPRKTGRRLSTNWAITERD